MDLLVAKDITQSYQGVPTIKNINMTLQKGELVCLLGVSGCGKTTLFNILAGLSLPDSGKVYLEGMDVTGKPGHISYMQQQDLLLPFKTILDNVSLPLLIRRVEKSAARATALTHFEEFGLLGTENKYPSQLSGGMRQRAALLRTYLFSDKVALLDEPFSALDALTKEKIHAWYLEVMEKIHLSTIFVSHDMDEAILLSHRIYIMGGKPGQILAEIPVTLPRPRSTALIMEDEFLEYKKRIRHIFTGQEHDEVP